VKVGDTLWRVTGSDMPAGTKVRVTSVGQNTLDVVATE
jgi:membrane protein implicated in regulation of membrane protease activity